MWHSGAAECGDAGVAGVGAGASGERAIGKNLENDSTLTWEPLREPRLRGGVAGDQQSGVGACAERRKRDAGHPEAFER